MHLLLEVPVAGMARPPSRPTAHNHWWIAAM